MPDKKILYVKFQDTDTLWENGRHLFAILNAFSLANYQIYLCDSVIQLLQNIFGSNLDDFPLPARLALRLNNVVIVKSPPIGVEAGIYIFDIEDKYLRGRKWAKKIQLKFDLVSSYRFSKPMIMPYAVHPAHATEDFSQRAKALRATPRKVRALFAGDSKGYRRKWIHYPGTKLSRLNVLETIRTRMAGDTISINDISVLEAIFNNYFTQKCVIVDSEAR